MKKTTINWHSKIIGKISQIGSSVHACNSYTGKSLNSKNFDKLLNIIAAFFVKTFTMIMLYINDSEYYR